MNLLKTLLLLSLSPLSAYSEQNSCLEDQIIIPYEDSDDISYLRVHPSGKYLMYTNAMGEGSNILELKISPSSLEIINYKTPLMDESYPVEPSWDLISSPYHDDGTMKFFAFKDLVTLNSENATAVYSSQFNEFYHSLGGDDKNFTMTRWNFLGSRTFKKSVANKKIQIKENLSTFLMCHNLFDLPPELKEIKEFLNNGLLKILSLTSKPVFENVWEVAETQVMKEYEEKGLTPDYNDDEFLSEIRKLSLKLTSELFAIEVAKGKIKASDVKNYNILMSLFDDYEDKNKGDDRSSYLDTLDEYLITKPILSKDANYISGTYKDQTRVYKINIDKTCTEVASLGSEVAKSSFSYPGSFKNPLITFYTESIEADSTMMVYIFDPVEKVTAFVGKTVADSNVGFPGFTKDGSLIYINNGEIIISKVKKSENSGLDKNCTQPLN